MPASCVYLDYNATTPLDPRVLEAMMPFLRGAFGNASSRLHPYGWQASEAVEAARSQVAKLLGASAREIVFTSGATEANNLALLGICRAVERGSSPLKGPARNHLITQATEHHAVLEPCEQLARRGFQVTVLRPDRAGRVRARDVADAITDRTLLVSVMLANNETGTLQPVREIGDLVRGTPVVFHTDAAQAVGKIPIDVSSLGVDLLSLSAHKLCGPKGAGALWARRGATKLRLSAIQFGGGQEGGLRPGTLNVPGIVGFGAACGIAAAELTSEAARVSALRDLLERTILSGLDGVTVNGFPEERLPGTSNLSFADIDGTALIPSLPELAISSGAACSTGSQEPSHVLRAMGVPERLGLASLRLSLGRFTTEEEVHRAAERVVATVRGLREQMASSRRRG